VTFGVMLLMGYSTIVAVITGLIVCVTAEAMSVEILKEYDMLKSKIGEIIILAATLDDFVEVLFISALVTYVDSAKHPEQGIMFMMFSILIFFTLIYATRFVILPGILRFLQKEQSGSQLFIIGVLMVLLVSVVAEYLNFGALIGAFLAGMVVKYTLLDAHEYKEQREMKDMFEAATFGFLAPFFFIYIGMSTDLSTVIKQPVLGLTLAALAFGTKIAGSLIGTRISGGTMLEGLTIGVATANKGIVEVVAAEIARSAGLITQEFFTAVIFMTVMTTMISPIVFSRLVKKVSTS
jgi:Kef-type K+ transport system membrane component KefB